LLSSAGFFKKLKKSLKIFLLGCLCVGLKDEPNLLEEFFPGVNYKLLFLLFSVNN